MKKILLATFLVVTSILCVSAQIKNPANIQFSAVKKGADYEVLIKVTIAKPWHIYSQNTPAGGPLPTKIVFNKNPLITVVGKPKEIGKLEKIHDKNFDVDVLYYSNEVVYTQLVKVKPGVKTNITGTFEYMVCDDNECLPPTKKTFDIKLL